MRGKQRIMYISCKCTTELYGDDPLRFGSPRMMSRRSYVWRLLERMGAVQSYGWLLYPCILYGIRYKVPVILTRYKGVDYSSAAAALAAVTGQTNGTDSSSLRTILFVFSSSASWPDALIFWSTTKSFLGLEYFGKLTWEILIKVCNKSWWRKCNF